MPGKAEQTQSKMHLLDTGQKLGAKQLLQEYKKESTTRGYAVYVLTDIKVWE